MFSMLAYLITSCYSPNHLSYQEHLQKTLINFKHSQTTLMGGVYTLAATSGKQELA